MNVCEALSTIHGKQYNLSFDGMLIAQGISDGDVNLWGIENPLTITKSQKHLEFKLKLAKELEMRLTDSNACCFD